MLANCITASCGYNGLTAFLNRQDCSITQFKLLCFMVRHPHTRLSMDTMAGVLDLGKAGLRHELAELIEKGILLQTNDDNHVTYSLSSEPEIQGYMRQLAALDWSAKLNVMAHL